MYRDTCVECCIPCHFSLSKSEDASHYGIRVLFIILAYNHVHLCVWQRQFKQFAVQREVNGSIKEQSESKIDNSNMILIRIEP